MQVNGKALRQLRLKQRLSVNQLAGLARCSSKTIQRLEAGISGPSFERILQVLGQSANRNNFILLGSEAFGLSEKKFTKLFEKARRQAGLPPASHALRAAALAHGSKGRPKKLPKTPAPKTVDAILTTAAALWHAHQYEDAIALLDSAVHFRPRDNALKLQLANYLIALRRGDLHAHTQRAQAILEPLLANPALPPDHRAEAHHHLGTALLNHPLLDPRLAATQSITHLQAALTTRRRETHPRDWASSTNNLAIALARSPNPDDVRRASDLFRQVIEIRTRETMPHDWALTMRNIGNCWHKLAGEDPLLDRDHLSKAIRSYQVALEVHTQESHPLEFGRLQYGLGSFYMQLAQAEDTPESHDARSLGRKCLRTAIATFTLAEQKDYSYAHYNLAELIHADPKATEKELWEAVASLAETLRVYPREVNFYEWAPTHALLSGVLNRLASQVKSGQKYLQKMAALSAQNAASPPPAHI